MRDAIGRRGFLAGSAGVAALGAMPALAQAIETVPVRIETREVIGPLPHIWEECVGSDRAAITLRESWRQDIDRAKVDLGIKRVRFHGIFNDELGVKTRTWLSRSGKTNFRDVAEVYDGLVSRNLAPFVELGFMPSELASGTRTFGFYNGNVTPAKSLDDYAAFIREFGTFLVDRYGIAAVSQWPIEVWNEPNLSAFWTGTQGDYFQMYKAAVVALKGIDPRLQVGGPATSSTQWLPEFLSFCATENAPVDFVSTHIYAGDAQKPLFGDEPRRPITAVIPEAVRRARAKVRASAKPALPMFINEWSSDSPAMIAHVLSSVMGETEMMSHWVLSGTYEELGVYDFLISEGSMGWPQMMRGIPLPSYNTYRLMHALGHRRLRADGPALASRREDGRLAALVWNLAEVGHPAGLPDATAVRKPVGAPKRMALTLAGLAAGQAVRVRYVDQHRGSPVPAWTAMGKPRFPTIAQIETLRRAAQVAAPEVRRLGAGGTLMLDLPPEGVALIEAV
jgi:xylan 1,4-beta-xylosidase